MKATLVVLGVFAALFSGVAVLFTLGEVAAVLTLALIVGLLVYGLFASDLVVRGLLAGVVVVLVASATFVGFGALQLMQAFTDTDGPVDPPDPVALASADAKVDDIGDSVAFQLELTEAEMTAYVLDGLQDEPDNPLRSVMLDVVDGEEGEQGFVTFETEFKSGGVGASGSVTAEMSRGAVKVKLADLEVGAFDLPGIAQGALEDLIERLADFNETLATTEADVQTITIGNDRILIVGTQLSTELLTSQDLLDGLRASAATAVNAVEPPPERLGPGVVNSISAAGSPVYVAIGDSLAANVGVDQAADGYVSRFHNQLQMRDNALYGLRNFGVSGETTGTLMRGGQLDAAVEFMGANDVAYVTIDIGANNLLGHLGSDDCSRSLDDAECQARVRSAFDGYDDDLAVIFEEITDAAPDATVIFLTAYNPFSLGLGTQFEASTDIVLEDFNAIARDVAADFDVIVADGFSPMQFTTAATTHMLDAPPDIHPLPIGYDILGGALVDALAR